jgi:AraC-like DNA-binding protein
MMSEGTVDILIPLEGRTTISSGVSNDGAVTVAEPVLIGPQKSYSMYDTSECVRALGIVFTPGGGARFFGPRIGEITDSIIPARDAIGATFRILHDRLLEERDPGRMFGLAEAFLRKRFDLELRYAEEIDYAISAIRRGETANVSLVDFAEKTIGFSHKHFVELFRRHVGLTPKRYQQISHFNGMLERCRLSPRVPWRQLTQTFGYADPSHLIKDFHRLAGMTPGDYLRTAWSHRQVLRGTTTGDK